MSELSNQIQAHIERLPGYKISLQEAVKRLGITKSKLPYKVARRYLFWEFCAKNTKLTRVEIGKLTGHDHSTVVYGLKNTGAKWMNPYRDETNQVLNLIEV